MQSSQQSQGLYTADQEQVFFNAPQRNQAPYYANREQAEVHRSLRKVYSFDTIQEQYSSNRRQLRVGRALGEVLPSTESRTSYGIPREQAAEDRHLRESQYYSGKSQISYGSNQGQEATGVFTQLTNPNQNFGTGITGRRQAQGGYTMGSPNANLQGVQPSPDGAAAQGPLPLPLLLVNMQGGTPSADIIGTVEYMFSANTMPADFPGGSGVPQEMLQTLNSCVHTPSAAAAAAAAAAATAATSSCCRCRR